jgi:hypothetical protein
LAFATKIVSLPLIPILSSSALPTGNTTPPSHSILLDTCFPAIPKTFFPKGMQHDNPLVAFLVSNFLAASLQKAIDTIAALEDVSRRLEEGSDGVWARSATKLRETLRERLPDPQILVALVQRHGATVDDSKAPSAPSEGSDMLVLSALRLLWQYHLLLPSVGPSIRFDFTKLLDSRLSSPTTDPIGALSQFYLLKLVSRRDIIPSGNRILPLIELFLSTKLEVIRGEAAITLKKLLGTSVAFEQNVDELDVWLSALPPSGSHGREAAVSFFWTVVQATLKDPFRYLEAAQELRGGTNTMADCSPLAAAALERLSDRSQIDRDALDAVAKYSLALVVGFCGSYSDLTFAKEFVRRISPILGPELQSYQDALRSVFRILEGKLSRSKVEALLEKSTEL